MRNNDNKQDVSLAVLENRVATLTKAVESFETKLDAVVRSFGNDKNNCKDYIDTNFVTKKEVQPLFDVFNKITKGSFGFIIIMAGVIVVLGLAAWNLVREKLGI